MFRNKRAIALSNEEARTVIKALRRSAQAMPEMTETFGSRDMRSMRELRIADRVGRMMGDVA